MSKIVNENTLVFKGDQFPLEGPEFERVWFSITQQEWVNIDHLPWTIVYKELIILLSTFFMCNEDIVPEPPCHNFGLLNYPNPSVVTYSFGSDYYSGDRIEKTIRIFLDRLANVALNDLQQDTILYFWEHSSDWTLFSSWVNELRHFAVYLEPPKKGTQDFEVFQIFCRQHELGPRNSVGEANAKAFSHVVPHVFHENFLPLQLDLENLTVLVNGHTSFNLTPIWDERYQTSHRWNFDRLPPFNLTNPFQPELPETGSSPFKNRTFGNKQLRKPIRR